MYEIQAFGEVVDVDGLAGGEVGEFLYFGAYYVE
jgi:hypothetical protein